MQIFFFASRSGPANENDFFFVSGSGRANRGDLAFLCRQDGWLRRALLGFGYAVRPPSDFFFCWFGC